MSLGTLVEQRRVRNRCKLEREAGLEPVTPTLARYLTQFDVIQIGIASLWRSSPLPWVYFEDWRATFDGDPTGIEKNEARRRQDFKLDDCGDWDTMAAAKRRLCSSASASPPADVCFQKPVRRGVSRWPRSVGGSRGDG